MQPHRSSSDRAGAGDPALPSRVHRAVATFRQLPSVSGERSDLPLFAVGLRRCSLDQRSGR